MKTLNMLIFSILLASNIHSQKAVILEQKEDITITEIKILDSDFRETNISISPDGKYLYFMSDRGGMSWSTSYGSFKGKQRFDGDIWYSINIDNEWQKPVCLDNSVNTYTGEDEPNISPDGQFVTYQSWAYGWDGKGGPYYTAILEKGKWTKPQGLGGGINKFFSDQFKKNYTYATDGMSISPDKNTYIVTCGSNYEGNMDLYLSKRENEKWSYCEKMKISTDLDERSVFIAGDGKTIFFASNGYGGFGGLDIFKTTLNEDGTFGEIYNLGEPFNTVNDDYSFILTASGEDAYFVRDGDIFHADLSDANEELKPEPTIIISGVINYCENSKIETLIDLYNVDENNKVATSKSSSEGEFSFVFEEKSGNYKIVSTDSKKYQIDTSFYVSELNKYQEIVINIDACKKVSTKTDIVENDDVETEISDKKNELSLQINFDFNDDSLKTEYFDDIDEFIKEIDKLDNYKVEIIGHTDTKGSDEYNVNLGLRRAENVQKYLTDKGVPKGKIKTSTKGEKTPAERNETDENSYLNRRVELKIIYYE
jgi:outer membrane protein OmpA-like peptidoglycan-associated protein/Tol biopolymer transport system component